PKDPFQRGFARVANVRLANGVLTATVRIDKPAVFSHEDAPDLGPKGGNWKSKDVKLRLDLNAEPRVIRVFSTKADARKAVLTLAGFLLRRDLGLLPTKEQEKFLRPVSFEESFVKRLKE